MRWWYGRHGPGWSRLRPRWPEQEVLYQIVRVLYHETASGRPPGAPGEQHSIETVLDAALQHMLRTVRAMAEDNPTTPATISDYPQGPF